MSRNLKLIFSAILAFLLVVGYLAVERLTAPPPPDRPPTASAIGGPFSLVDQNGVRRTDADFRGRYMLVNFGYTGCPDFCPVVVQAISDALSMLGAQADKLQPIFITVDPARDQPQQLKAFLDAFDKRFVGLTGTEDEIKAAMRAYRVFAAKKEPDASGNYTVDHTTLTYLIDPDGKYVTHLRHNLTAEQMAELLKANLKP
ncbi:MAG: SCO family protein [Alphaproteobacteria bacterium]